MDLGVGIWALGLRFGPQESRLGFGPQGFDMGLKDEIWAWRLGEGYKGGEGEGENFPYMWKHRSSTPLEPLTKKEV